MITGGVTLKIIQLTKETINAIFIITLLVCFEYQILYLVVANRFS
jgi:hypothetical protein